MLEGSALLLLQVVCATMDAETEMMSVETGQNRKQNRKCRCYSDSRTTGSNASTASQAAATATVSTKQATMHLHHPTWEEDDGRFGA